MQYREFEGPAIAMGVGGGDENQCQENKTCRQGVEKMFLGQKGGPTLH